MCIYNKYNCLDANMYHGQHHCVHVIPYSVRGKRWVLVLDLPPLFSEQCIKGSV